MTSPLKGFCEAASSFPFLVIAYFIFCSAFAKCAENQGLKFTIKDEFGDEASVLRQGGVLEITCDREKNFDFEVRGPPDFFGQEGRRKIMVLTNITGNKFGKILSKGYELSLKCDEQSDGKAGIRFKGILCDATDSMICGKDGSVCLRDGYSGRRTCGQMAVERGRTLIQSQFRVCVQVGEEDNHRLLRETFLLSQFNDTRHRLWPQVEIAVNYTDEPYPFLDKNKRCKQVENYWKPNLGLRDVITVSESFTLKPVNSESCNKAKVTCQLKTMNQAPSLTGNCSHGWTVNVTDIWESEKTKLLCTGNFSPRPQNGHPDSRWQYYLYPTLATVLWDPDNHKLMCQWPKWVNKAPTALRGKKCRKKVQFNFPPTAIGKTFEFHTGEIPSTPTETTINHHAADSTSSFNITLAPAWTWNFTDGENGSFFTTEYRTSTSHAKKRAGSVKSRKKSTVDWKILASVVLGVMGISGILLLSWFLFLRHKKKKMKKNEQMRRETIQFQYQ